MAASAFQPESGSGELNVSVYVVNPGTKEVLSLKRSGNKEPHGEVWSTAGGGADPLDDQTYEEPRKAARRSLEIQNSETTAQVAYRPELAQAA